MSFSPASLSTKLRELPEAPCYWIAYSGGLDSHVLLHAMAQLSTQLAGPLRAIHVQHGLQPDAEQWLQHSIEESTRLGVVLTPLRLSLKPAKGESLEAVAREARYQAMRRLIGPGELLLTAQHQNDQAETLILQLLRGSGPSGLAAMPELAPFGSGQLARPLLDFTRAELTTYAKQNGLRWIEDGSNADLRFDRNYIRHQLMPVIEKRWPAYSNTLARSARHCAEAQQLIDQLALADRAEVQGNNSNRLSVARLYQLSPPRCRAVLRHWIEDLGFQLPSTQQLERIVDEVMAAAEDRTPLVAWTGAEVRRFRDHLFVMAPLPQHDPAVTIPWLEGSSLLLPGGSGSLHVGEQVDGGIDPDCWQRGEIEVRFRQGGERCRRQGEGVSRSLKKIFQEVLQIPPWLRDRVPLLYIDGKLAAVGDFFICESFAASPGQSGIALHWETDISACPNSKNLPPDR